MADPVTGQPPNDYLNRKQLVRSEAYGDTILRTLLDTLLLDSVFSLTDDFTGPFDGNRWGWGASESADTGFHVIDTDTGHLAASAGQSDDGAVWLFEQQPRWSPRKRCLTQARVDIASVTSLKFEYGFVSAAINLNDVNIDGAVALKATPTANTFMDAFAVSIYDVDDDTNLSLVQNLNGALTSADQSGPAALASGTHTLLVAMNEGGGALFWLNGIKAGQVQGDPADRIADNGTMTSVVESKHATTGVYGLWFFLQNRAASAGQRVRIDYIHARQDRATVN